MLILFRFIQAIGAAAGLVVGQATISDQFSLNEAAKVYNVIYPIVAISPAIAPLIGGYIATFLGWQATFSFVALYGFVLIILTYFFLNETNTNQVKKSILSVFNDYPKLIVNRSFLSYVIPVCLVYGTWFTYLSQSTFLFNNIGYSQHTVGYFYIPLAIMIYVGNLLSKLLLAKNYHTEQVFMLGVLSFIAGGMLFVVSLLFFDMKNAVEIILPMSLVSVSNGIVLPIGIASAINIFKEKSGVASGLVGFVQIGFSALCASFIGELFGISFVILAITVFLMSVTALVSHLVLRKYSLYVASANM